MRKQLDKGLDNPQAATPISPYVPLRWPHQDFSHSLLKELPDSFAHIGLRPHPSHVPAVPGMPGSVPLVSAGDPDLAFNYGRGSADAVPLSNRSHLPGRVDPTSPFPVPRFYNTGTPPR